MRNNIKDIKVPLVYVSLKRTLMWDAINKDAPFDNVNKVLATIKPIVNPEALIVVGLDLDLYMHSIGIFSLDQVKLNEESAVSFFRCLLKNMILSAANNLLVVRYSSFDVNPDCSFDAHLARLLHIVLKEMGFLFFTYVSFSSSGKYLVRDTGFWVPGKAEAEGNGSKE